MALADLAKLGVRKLVVDVDDGARTVIGRRLLLRFLLKHGGYSVGADAMPSTTTSAGTVVNAASKQTGRPINITSPMLSMPA